MDLMLIGLSVLTGMILGGIYFSGLWYTVRKISDFRHPVVAVFLSFGVRASLAVIVFFLVMDGKWERLIAALLGFILIREISVKRLRRV